MAEKKTYPFVVLDDTTLTNGIRVLVAGVDTAQFEKNPVALYLHNDWSMPVGTWENIRKENGKLMADFVPDYDDSDKEVQRLIGKVDRGVIKMASAGLVDLNFSDMPEYITEERNKATVIGCRLREISIVPIGKNHNALRLFDNEGKELNLSDKTLNLSDYFLKGNINKDEKKMKKEILTALNLADTATQAQIDEAIELLLADKQKSDNKATELQGKLDAIDTAKKEAQKTEALNLVDAALKDGRLSEKEDGSVKRAWLELFDNNHETAKTMLEGLVKHVPASDTLEMGDTADGEKTPKTSAWDKRQREIEENAKKK